MESADPDPHQNEVDPKHWLPLSPSTPFFVTGHTVKMKIYTFRLFHLTAK